MLFLKVVMVVSKSQYEWVKNGDAPQDGGFPSQSGKLSTAFRDTSKERGSEKEKIPLHPL